MLYLSILVNANILILFGTEAEEDQGGFLNFYTITPDTLVKDLDKQYSKVFGRCLEYFCEEDKETVNKLYKDFKEEFILLNYRK